MLHIYMWVIFVASNNNNNKTVIMKIQVNTVEGKTTRKGTKQGRVYEITSASKTEDFFYAVSGDVKYSIWNVNGDWSLIGISKGEGNRRYSYTSNFIIL